MAKKKRRSKQSVSSAKPRSYSGMYKNDNTVPQPKNADDAQATATVIANEDNDRSGWKTEYAYVFSELRVLSIVSIVLFALIIGISFFL